MSMPDRKKKGGNPKNRQGSGRVTKPGTPQAVKRPAFKPTFKRPPVVKAKLYPNEWAVVQGEKLSEDERKARAVATLQGVYSYLDERVAA